MVNGRTSCVRGGAAGVAVSPGWVGSGVVGFVRWDPLVLPAARAAALASCSGCLLLAFQTFFMSSLSFSLSLSLSLCLSGCSQANASRLPKRPKRRRRGGPVVQVSEDKEEYGLTLSPGFLKGQDAGQHWGGLSFCRGTLFGLVRQTHCAIDTLIIQNRLVSSWCYLGMPPESFEKQADMKPFRGVCNFTERFQRVFPKQCFDR